MAAFDRPWVFCGGWAIDLSVGRPTRPHKDVDIAIWRRDQLLLQTYLIARGWSLEIAHHGTLTPWSVCEYLELPRHGVWARHGEHTPGFLEVLLNETDGTRFRFRRDPSIRLALDHAFLRPQGELPRLAPEIVLLYKSSDATAPENKADFCIALPSLDDAQRAWLKAGLEKLRPDHPWIWEL